MVTDQAAGTAGMKLVERPEPQAARLASLSGASPKVAADAQTYAELEARVLAGGMEGIALRYGFYYGPGTWFHPDGAYADKVRRQEFPIIGAGSGVWSWVHIEDAAGSLRSPRPRRIRRTNAPAKRSSSFSRGEQNWRRSLD